MIVRPQVWAGMATLRERTQTRPAAVESLIGQVDRLILFPGEPDPARGDQLKLAACQDAPAGAVYCCVDDDIVYPPDYVARLLAGLAAHPGCIVGFHGWMIGPDGRRGAGYPCLWDVPEDHQVDVIGTVCCAFCVDTIRPAPGDFPTHQADVWLSALAERQGVPRVVLAHERGWLGYMAPPRTIWDETQAKTGSGLDTSVATAAGCAAILAERAA